MDKIQIRKQEPCENLDLLTKEELIEKVKALQAHNTQLKNIINKSKEEKSKKTHFRNKPFDFSKCKFRHILLRFFYLGWDYQGFVTQEDTTNTVEYHLFEALMKTCLIKDRVSSNYHRCGRTDKGVSSFGQVISIDVRSKHNDESQNNLSEELDYCNILNRVLPENIRCIAWAPVDPSISARFDCTSRTYKYYFPKGKLDIAKMCLASQYLLGDHDFRNLCKMDVGNGVVKFTRNISSFTIEPFESINNDDEFTMYVATIKSQAFLWHQIRCIMSILFHVGEQREVPEIVKELVDVINNPRKPEYNMASEIPLNLYFCEYDFNTKWQYSSKNADLVLQSLSNLWSVCSTKQTIIKDMLESLQNEMKIKSFFLTEFLIQGVKPKNYVPLMKRQKCDSLEDKIEHYTKRKRIEVIKTEDNIMK